MPGGVIPRDRATQIVVAVVLLILIYQWGKSYLRNREIDSHSAETIGVVVDYHRSGRSNTIAQFEYKVNGVPYRVSSIEQRFNDCLSTRWCIGERYVIRYSALHPELARVLWDKHLPRVDSVRTQ